MKKIKKLAIGFLIWTTLVYLSFAFVIADFNAFNWAALTRAFMLCFVLVYPVFFITVALDELET